MKIEWKSMKSSTRFVMIITLVYIVLYTVFGGIQLLEWGSLVGISLNPTAILVVAGLLFVLALYAGSAGQGILEAIKGFLDNLFEDPEEEAEEKEIAVPVPHAATVRRRRTVVKSEDLHKESDPVDLAAVAATKPKCEVVVDMPFAPETLAQMAKNGLTMELSKDGTWKCVPLK